MKVLTVVGTRPEAIKLAPVIREFATRSEQIESVLCATAQHREMLDQVLRDWDIPCAYDLDVMRHDQTLAQLTARLLERLDPVIVKERPDWVLVQGDTTTVVAASLAAFYRRVRVAHVEAGLRTWNRLEPFPEEVNRRMVGCVADLHFAPTEEARRNLLREGVAPEAVITTGNTVIDALYLTRDRLLRHGAAAKSAGPRRILVTVHRRENFGEPLTQICAAIRELSRDVSGIEFVVPVHPNPNVKSVVESHLGDLPNVQLREPLPYSALVETMMGATLVLTDSGGLQEEAPALQVPVLVLRDVTERPEGVAAGLVKLVGADRARIVDTVKHLLSDDAARAAMTSPINPYGDGKASQRIVHHLIAVTMGAQANLKVPA